MLALNPRALADARASDAERAAGRIRGPFHGIPVAYKDNIDVLGLPSTGGSRALVDHLPRLDSRMAAAMRPAARSSSARRTSTSFRSAISASARSPGRSGMRTIHRSAPRARAAAAQSRCHQPRHDRLRDRHLQFAVEPRGVRGAGDDPHDAGADQPRRRHAAQYRTTTRSVRWRNRCARWRWPSIRSRGPTPRTRSTQEAGVATSADRLPPVSTRRR